MRGNNVQRKGGKAKGIISFFVGLLLGIIIIVGAIVGGTYYVLNADIDSVLGMAGLDNSKDENGRNKLINTDLEAGGVKNLLELIGRLSVMATDFQNMTLGELDSLVPATRGLTDQLLESFRKYVAIDYDELCQVKFSELNGYVENLVMDIQPASFIDEMNAQGSMNPVLELVLYGVEANYVESPQGEKYPLYADNYRYNADTGNYERVEDSAVLEKSQEQYIVKQSANNDLYDIFFFVKSDGAYISERDPDDIMKFYYSDSPEYGYAIYNADYADCTGNYYINNAGEKQIIEPITLRSLMEDGGTGSLEKVRVIELIGDGEPDELLETILGDASLGDLMNGNVDFTEKINGMELGLVLTLDPFKDDLLLYLAYKLTGLSVEPDEEGRYTATYKSGDEERAAFVTIEGDEESGYEITSVTDAETGEQLSGTKVEELSDSIDGIEVDIFFDVSADDSIMAYIAYGLTKVTPPETDGVWTAKFGENDCQITVDGENIIQSVTDTVTGEKVNAAKIDELSDRMSTITDALTMGEIIDAGDSKVLQQLAPYKISELDTAVDELEISALIDVTTDDTVLAYLAFGIRNIKDQEGVWTAKLKVLEDEVEREITVYLKVYQKEPVELAPPEPDVYYIEGVYKTSDFEDMSEENVVEGTHVKDMSERVDGIMEDLTVGELINLDPESGNIILNAIKDATINNLDQTISTLTLNELYAEEIYKTTVYKDDDGDGKADVDDDGQKIIDSEKSAEAKLRLAVDGEPVGDGQIRFNTDYLYYVKTVIDGEESYSLVQKEGQPLGKLESLDSGEYYTYGAPQLMWTLILTEEGGDEAATKLNDIGSVITRVNDRLNNSTLSELDAAGIIDLTDASLENKLPADPSNRTVGQLKLSEALDLFVNSITAGG